MRRLARVHGALLLLFAACLFAVVPGSDLLPYDGIPLGAAELATLVAFSLGLCVRSPRIARDSHARVCALALVLVALAKAGAAAFALPHGWLASYYANSTFSGAPEWSSAFRFDKSSRLDAYIAFANDQGVSDYPIYFFNEMRFNRGDDRAYSEPFSVTWQGFAQLAEPTDLELVGAGSATLQIDDTPPIDATSDTVALGAFKVVLAAPPGQHEVRVRYVKPANIEGSIRLSALSRGLTTALGGRQVAPRPIGAEETDRDSLAWWAILSTELAAAGLLLGGLALWRLRRTTVARLGVLRLDSRGGPISVVTTAPARWWLVASTTLLAAQGLIRAWPLAGRYMSLSGGDDWLAYEGNARNILATGLLMTGGVPLGQGVPFFFHPLYPYLLALEHVLGGESLFAPILGNFLCLAGANIAICFMARTLFRRVPPAVIVLLLLFVEELAFVRWYTPALFSDNLYFLTLPLGLLALVRAGHTQDWKRYVVAGLCLGIATLTRPQLELFLPITMGYVIWSAWAQKASVVRILLIGLAFVTTAAATIGLATLRNELVSGQLVLTITPSDVLYLMENLDYVPARQDYLELYAQQAPTVPNTSLVLLLDIVKHYPLQVLEGLAAKALFAVGFTNLYGSALHPELLAISGLYMAYVFTTSKQATRHIVLLHLFVFTHLATVVLVTPNNYGYRLVLPMYLVMAGFAADVLARGALSFQIGRRVAGASN